MKNRMKESESGRCPALIATLFLINSLWMNTDSINIMSCSSAISAGAGE